MRFIDYWAATKPRLDEALACQIPALFNCLAPEQIETIRHIIEDGKRIRGCLVCLTAQGLGGKRQQALQQALPRAVAVECIQAASLVHDDYVDNDLVRRERPATWTLEGPRRAVLLGDVMFATAILAMVELSREDGAAIAKAIATVAAGAYQELHYRAAAEHGRASPLPANAYERIIYLKTGALFGAACELGAIAAGTSGEMCANAHAFGARTGEAYQIADDLADLAILERTIADGVMDLSSLAPALHHFSCKQGIAGPPRSNNPAAFKHWWLQKERSFVRHMGQEIAERLRRAEDHARHFPDNACARVLRAAPAEIVTMMHHRSRDAAIAER